MFLSIWQLVLGIFGSKQVTDWRNRAVASALRFAVTITEETIANDFLGDIYSNLKTKAKATPTRADDRFFDFLENGLDFDELMEAVMVAIEDQFKRIEENSNQWDDFLLPILEEVYSLLVGEERNQVDDIYFNEGDEHHDAVVMAFEDDLEHFEGTRKEWKDNFPPESLATMYSMLSEGEKQEIKSLYFTEEEMNER